MKLSFNQKKKPYNKEKSPKIKVTSTESPDDGWS